jgi:hypothetical protein
LPRSGQELVNARKSRLCDLHVRAMPAQELSSVSRTSANAEYQHSGRFVKPLELTGKRKSVATGQVIVHDCHPRRETLSFRERLARVRCHPHHHQIRLVQKYALETRTDRRVIIDDQNTGRPIQATALARTGQLLRLDCWM